MLSIAKSANVRFLQVVQLFAPPTNPADAENSFYKFKKKFFWVSTMCTQILGLVRLGLGFRVTY